MPKISVIIPVYNVEKYLRRCLDSLLSQTFTDWNAICVNDGSTDKSGEILSEYAARDSRFVVITNTGRAGPSVARNMGMAAATGDYILFVDGDDFIHPQTMEITYFLAMRDGTDIVSFTYNRNYRPKLMLRHKLGLKTDGIEPRGILRRYNPARVAALVTDDIFKYATEQTHNAFNPRRKWLIKHCQVWKNLYRRDLISDIKFIDGILYEDFPWWSAVMLKNPRVTIAPLPLYYYRPNFGGIFLSAGQMNAFCGICVGIKDTFLLYQKNASQYQNQQWAKNFKWYFIKWAFGKIKHFTSAADLKIARDWFCDLNKCGALDTPPNKKRKKLRRKINKFIGKDCKHVKR